MLRIAIFGAGGRAGGAATAEASSRGHLVTALRRSEVDVTDPQAVATAARGHDAVVASVAPADGGDPVEFYRAASSSLVSGLIDAGRPQLVWVSIASLLPNATGVAPIDDDGFPLEYRPFSLGHRAALETFARSSLRWTAVSPSGDFDRNGSPRADYVLTDMGDLEARITYADHARAVVDLAEPLGEQVGRHVGVRPRG